MLTIQELHELVVSMIAESGLNHLSCMPYAEVIDEPLVGVASGDDPLFARYKTIIGAFHMTPREALGLPADTDVSVVCWVLPFSSTIKKSNAKKDAWPSTKWVAAYYDCEGINNYLRGHLEAYFGARGVKAVAPVTSPRWRRIEDLPGGHTSNWSERHALYAAGLGTFSLNDGFITEKGMAMRCGTVVVGTKLPVTPRRFRNHTENCLYAQGKGCGLCIDRCPAFAITGAGHDKVLCRHYRQTFIHDYLHKQCGIKATVFECGLCQTGVPCESANPMRAFQHQSGYLPTFED